MRFSQPLCCDRVVCLVRVVFYVCVSLVLLLLLNEQLQIYKCIEGKHWCTVCVCVHWSTYTHIQTNKHKCKEKGKRGRDRDMQRRAAKVKCIINALCVCFAFPFHFLARSLPLLSCRMIFFVFVVGVHVCSFVTWIHIAIIWLCCCCCCCCWNGSRMHECCTKLLQIHIVHQLKSHWILIKKEHSYSLFFLFFCFTRKIFYQCTMKGEIWTHTQTRPRNNKARETGARETR